MKPTSQKFERNHLDIIYDAEVRYRSDCGSWTHIGYAQHPSLTERQKQALTRL